MRSAALLAGALLALSLGFVPGASAAKRVVKAKDIDFTPAKLTVRRGSTVVWRFLDSTQHDVRSRGKRRFRGSKPKRMGTHTIRFRKAGRYRYVCTFHPLTMKGVVVVRRRSKTNQRRQTR